MIRFHRSISGIGALALACSGLVVVAGAPPALALAGTISGRVFRDFNGNGVLDTSGTAAAPAVDVGIAGAQVRAYGDDNTLLGSATTSASGTYTVTYTDNGSRTSSQVRVELDTPADMVPTPAGLPRATNGTSVQFVSAGAHDVDYAVAFQHDYQDDPDPRIYAARQVATIDADDVPGGSPRRSTIVSMLYDDRQLGTDDGSVRSEATVRQTGSIWGLAALEDRAVFTGAMLKRHAQLGRGGLGAVYLTVPGGAPDAKVFAKVADAGTDPRTIDTDWFFDDAVYGDIGKVGLGGLALAPDSSSLYTVNLHTKQLVEIALKDTGTGEPTAGDQTSVAIPTPPGCAAADSRPYGVSQARGALWVGQTCVGPKVRDLAGYVYRFDTTTGTFGATPAFTLGLDYPRGNVVEDYPGNPDGAISAAWGAWDDTGSQWPGRALWPSRPQPIVSSVAFDSDGAMTIAIKDRFGDQSGYRTGSPNVDAGTDKDFTYLSATAGDTLRACGTEATGWTLERNGSCGGRVGSSPGNEQGPGGGEFYQDDYFDVGRDAAIHQQNSLGALLQAPGFPDVVATTFDPGRNFDTNGYRFWGNADGNGDFTATGADWRQIGPAFSSKRNQDRFGKAGAMGELDLLAPQRPLEIGNRVWDDADSDGIQDGTEVGIAGVRVRLYDGDTVVGTTVTDAAGEYYFKDRNVDGGLLPGTDYTVHLDRATDYRAGGPLARRTTSPPDAVREAIDSDATIVGGFPRIEVTTGGPGADDLVDHTLDVGFMTSPGGLGDDTAPTTPPAEGASASGAPDGGSDPGSSSWLLPLGLGGLVVLLLGGFVAFRRRRPS
ncbi:hypothetical protein BH11ACT8_BH11ACT8_12470 [soil metagenome]